MKPEDKTEKKRAGNGPFWGNQEKGRAGTQSGEMGVLQGGRLIRTKKGISREPPRRQNKSKGKKSRSRQGTPRREKKDGKVRRAKNRTGRQRFGGKKKRRWKQKSLQTGDTKH